ncbi:PAS domain S-box protein [Nitrosococcus watsonii]|uniref:Putative PAS/PAC sensor protein n=1 Tax=Nitrosococcus watsoni (strain C-113) TaxID=105559 RepID=D8KBK7_NITWC|nr:PAS domain S-box protein [Nitrosococcus watsonii]ADJ29654.1 putative PAS/PAC sensor protein [Nitrosococcus watsonii C-113]
MSKRETDPIRAELELERELAKEKFADQALPRQFVNLKERLSQQAVELEAVKATLKESEERFNQIAAMTKEWIWEQDAEGRYTYCSASVNAILGYSCQTLMGRFYYEFAPAEEAEALRSKMQQGAETGEGVQRFIRRYQHQDGHLVFTESMATPIFDEQNHLLKWRGIDRDITATRRTDELVFMLSRALEQSPNAILITSLKGNIEYVNPSFTRLTGYQAEEVIGKNPSLLQSGKTPLEQYRRLWETIRAGREWRDEIQDRKKSGELYWALETITSLRDEKGNPTHFLAIQEDITERKRVEVALRESEAQTRLIIENALDAVILMNADELITDWNPQAEKIFGWEREEVLGASLADTIIPPRHREAHRQGLRRFLNTGKGPILGNRIELSALHRDGHEFPVELTVSPLNVGGSYMFSSFLRDLTQQKETEEAIRQARVKLAVAQNEMRIAQQIQESLFPSAPLILPTVKIMGHCLPATHVGGDYFDHFQWRDNTIDIVIADVSGHSVGPALLMVEARSALKAQFHLHRTVAETLSSLNKTLYEDLDRSDLFITLCYLRYDTVTRQLTYANAGHLPPLLFRQGQRCKQLDADGLVLGVNKEVVFEECSVSLQRGDMLFLYTDGITEAENKKGDFFGIERLCDLLNEYHQRGSEPREIIAAIIERLQAFRHRRTFEDDATMVVVQVL